MLQEHRMIENSIKKRNISMKMRIRKLQWRIERRGIRSI
jgi:Protein of unknown function (DUF3135)